MAQGVEGLELLAHVFGVEEFFEGLFFFGELSGLGGENGGNRVDGVVHEKGFLILEGGGGEVILEEGVG